MHSETQYIYIRGFTESYSKVVLFRMAFTPAETLCGAHNVLAGVKAIKPKHCVELIFFLNKTNLEYDSVKLLIKSTHSTRQGSQRKVVVQGVLKQYK